MLVIRTVGGVEIRLPLDQLDSITEVEPESGSSGTSHPIPICTARA